jgi:hypothetical protein
MVRFLVGGCTVNKLALFAEIRIAGQAVRVIVKSEVPPLLPLAESLFRGKVFK